MASFLNYRDIDFKIEDSVFHAERVDLSIQSSVDPIILSDGSLLDYSPSTNVVGSLSFDFYLTGAIPSYFNVTGVDESAVKVNFAEVEIKNCYLVDLSFSLEPFQPLLFSAEFDWYGNINVEDFTEQSEANRKNKSVPNYIAHAAKSYVDKESLDVGNIISLSYNSSCDRPAYFNQDETVPFRVAKLNKRCEVSLQSNSLGEMVSTKGKKAETNIIIKDFYGTEMHSFNISGVLTQQNYNISNGSYMLSNASIEQVVTENKVLI